MNATTGWKRAGSCKPSADLSGSHPAHPWVRLRQCWGRSHKFPAGEIVRGGRHSDCLNSNSARVLPGASVRLCGILRLGSGRSFIMLLVGSRGGARAPGRLVVPLAATLCYDLPDVLRARDALKINEFPHTRSRLTRVAGLAGSVRKNSALKLGPILSYIGKTRPSPFLCIGLEVMKHQILVEKLLAENHEDLATTTLEGP